MDNFGKKKCLRLKFCSKRVKEYLFVARGDGWSQWAVGELQIFPLPPLLPCDYSSQVRKSSTVLAVPTPHMHCGTGLPVLISLCLLKYRVSARRARHAGKDPRSKRCLFLGRLSPGFCHISIRSGHKSPGSAVDTGKVIATFSWNVYYGVKHWTEYHLI